MAESVVSKTAEFSAGVTPAMGMILDSSTSLHYAPVKVVASELGGCSVHRFVNAATNNAQVVKAAPGQLYGITVSSISDEVNYLKFYDLIVAPTVGSSTIKIAFAVPKSAVATDGETTSMWFPQGIQFSTGISLALIETITDAGTVAMDTADQILVNVFYK